MSLAEVDGEVHHRNRWPTARRKWKPFAPQGEETGGSARNRRPPWPNEGPTGRGPHPHPKPIIAAKHGPRLARGAIPLTRAVS